MGIRIVHAVFVILGGDQGQFFAFVTIAGEVLLSDGTKHPGKGGHPGGLFEIAGTEKNISHLGCGQCRHFFHADHQRNPAPARFDKVHGRMNRRRARRAGVFMTGGGSMGQSRIHKGNQG